MPTIKPGDCVKIPDGRIARVREHDGSKIRVRVRREASDTDQFLFFTGAEQARNWSLLIVPGVG
jgi:hypothetical protein